MKIFYEMALSLMKVYQSKILEQEGTNQLQILGQWTTTLVMSNNQGFCPGLNGRTRDYLSAIRHEGNATHFQQSMKISCS